MAEFYEPSSASNFLNRYNSAKKEDGAAAPAAPAAGGPPSPTIKRQTSAERAKAVWGKTFHPGGTAVKGKSNFDTVKPADVGTGKSTAEMAELKSHIHLDGRDSKSNFDTVK
eukprot:CAMPEP_0184719028 /NCGR_PEP_ID=MMETSP0314-20130426/8050_1 /TAXON_ID=38298 /ORGANISM="Rhodella maculata, Strain CCMP 736" /LENGTH=111 /DNA_ID=CAMNT_0027182857 /DNA_START=64 /DNA_END=396 /DNA_ORIENTATION=-